MGLTIAFGAGTAAVNFMWAPAVGIACGVAAKVIKDNNPNSNVARQLDHVGTQICQNAVSNANNNQNNNNISYISPPPLIPISPTINSNSNSNNSISTFINNNKTVKEEKKISYSNTCSNFYKPKNTNENKIKNNNSIYSKLNTSTNNNAITFKNNANSNKKTLNFEYNKNNSFYNTSSNFYD